MKKEKQKVSFDFDDTLDRESVQEYAKELVKRGFDVYIVTTRHRIYLIKQIGRKEDWVRSEKWNDDLYKIAKEIGIEKDHIIFTKGMDKYLSLKDRDFIWHLDNDWIELNLINKKIDAFGISVYGNWKHKCEKLL